MAVQRNLFEYEFHIKKMDKIGDPLLKMKEQIPWEELFREELDKAFGKEVKDKSKGGRPDYDSMLMFKILVLQKSYGLSDEETEYQINDRLSFQRFLDLDLSDNVPDARTIWLYRERLERTGYSKKLFDIFKRYLEEKGLVERKGIIVDASFVEVPRQRNTKEENKEIQGGGSPEGWSKKKASHKDIEARWTKKHGKTYYGYKNHIKADVESKVILGYEVSEASVHDSQVLWKIIDKRDSGKKLYGDSAYRSKEIEEKLKVEGIISCIQEKGYKYKKLRVNQIRRNRRISNIRARIEHIFGHITKSMGKFIRSIGIRRAVVNIGLMNLTYNIERALFLQRA